MKRTYKLIASRGNEIGGLSMIKVTKYRQTRFWAVDVDGELLAVVVDRKGARAIANLILSTRAGKAASDAA
jgi:hypothetical protein